jgi:hypothetical protein
MATTTRKRKTVTKPSSEETNPLLDWTDNEEVNHPRILLCGKPKKGKTHFIGTCPKPFIIDTDHGTLSIAQKHIPRYKLYRHKFESGDQSYMTVNNIIADLREKRGPVWEALEQAKYVPETIALDSASALSDLMEVGIVNHPPNGKDRDGITLTLPDYNIIQRRLFGIIDNLKSLPYMVVVTMGIDVELDEFNRLIESPSATGRKLGPKLPHFFDDIFKCDYDEKKEVWTMSPVATKQFEHAGTRNEGIPLKVYENPSWDTFSKYYG